jgi:hypothetical protein
LNVASVAGGDSFWAFRQRDRGVYLSGIVSNSGSSAASMHNKRHSCAASAPRTVAPFSLVEGCDSNSEPWYFENQGHGRHWRRGEKESRPCWDSLPCYHGPAAPTPFKSLFGWRTIFEKVPGACVQRCLRVF